MIFFSQRRSTIGPPYIDGLHYREDQPLRMIFTAYSEEIHSIAKIYAADDVHSDFRAYSQLFQSGFTAWKIFIGAV